MANAVEKLFDSINQNLPPGEVPEWPLDDTDTFPLDTEDEPVESNEDGIFSLDEEMQASDTLDKIAGRRVSGEPGPDESEVIEGGIRSKGFEALAFYKSIRLQPFSPFQGRWGIFYLKHGLLYVESEISKTYPGYGDTRSLALNFLRQHERFHYQADVQTLLFEATLGRHLYLPVRFALQGRASHFVEEALANRQVWDWSKRPSIGVEEFAFDFMSLQPNAYARFTEPRLQLASEWAGVIVDQKPPGSRFRDDLSHWVEAIPKNLLRSSLCPEYVVYPKSLGQWISPTLVTPPVREVIDNADVLKDLSGRYFDYQTCWEQTKQKLVEDRHQRGLNFKPWPKGGKGVYSVKVDYKFRAHLFHRGSGSWLAQEFGPHTKLGHG